MNYMQSVNEDLSEDRKNLEARELCATLLVNHLPHVNRAYTGQDYIALCLPASLPMLRVFRRQLGSDWVRKSKNQHTDGDVSITYTHKQYPQANLLVWLIVGADGATCHRELVEEKKVPIYQMVCQ